MNKYMIKTVIHYNISTKKLYDKVTEIYYRSYVNY